MFWFPNGSEVPQVRQATPTTLDPKFSTMPSPHVVDVDETMPAWVDGACVVPAATPNIWAQALQTPVLKSG